MDERNFIIRLYPKVDKAKKNGSVPIYDKLRLDKEKLEVATSKTVIIDVMKEHNQAVEALVPVEVQPGQL